MTDVARFKVIATSIKGTNGGFPDRDSIKEVPQYFLRSDGQLRYGGYDGSIVETLSTWGSDVVEVVSTGNNPLKFSPRESINVTDVPRGQTSRRLALQMTHPNGNPATAVFRNRTSGRHIITISREIPESNQPE